MVKIAVFYSAWTDSVRKIKEAGSALGVDLEVVHYSELEATMDDEVKLVGKGRDMSEFDVYYFRSVGDRNEWLPMLLDVAQRYAIPVVDEYLTKTGGAMRKKKGMEAWVLQQAGVPYAKSYMAGDLAGTRQIVREWEKPVVVKGTSGRHGTATFLVTTEAELEPLLKGRGDMQFIIQEYLPNDGDWRMFVVGGEVVGAFKRQVKEGDRLKLNRSLGQSMLCPLPDQMRTLARRACEALGVAVAGVDAVIDERDGQAKVIEVNQAPEFDVMEKRTGVAVGEKIVEYLIQVCGEKSENMRR